MREIRFGDQIFFLVFLANYIFPPFLIGAFHKRFIRTGFRFSPFPFYSILNEK